MRGKKHKFYYYYSYSFADAISPEIASGVMGFAVDTVNGFNQNRPRSSKFGVLFNRVCSRVGTVFGQQSYVLGLGSIYHHAKCNDIVWGSGINPYWQDRKLGSAICEDIRALRGPLSRDYLMRNYGICPPEVYGDPALLIPDLFPEFKRKDTSRKLLILGQHHDEEVLTDFVGEEFKHFTLICQKKSKLDWRVIVSNILKSEYVISTSLHGLIIADAFGVPSRWLHNKDLPSVKTEGRFKYNDYYLSTGRDEDQFATSVKQALDMGPIEKIQYFDKRKLLDAFPRQSFV